MKLVVIKAYVDKYSHELRDVGDEITVNNDRGKELLASGYVEEIKDKVDKTGDEE